MRRGCLNSLLFAVVLLGAFGLSTYFWFNFFVRGTSLPTPNLVGRSVADARAVCSDLGVTLNVDPNARRNSDKVAAGNIVWQNRTPGATSLIKRGTTIRVELSAGPLVMRVPDLDGTSAGTAVLRLGQQNLKLGTLAYAEIVNRNGIVSADPPNGTVVGPQQPVALLVAVPPQPPPYVMPDLIDHALDEVRPYIEMHGLKIATVKFESYPGIRDGIIIRQFPLRGSQVSARDAISVVVSKAEQDIIEQPQATAPLLGTTTTQ
jgi:beta-lactam-binding protein with PASTA domain